MFKENRKNFFWLAVQYLILVSTAFITLKINLDYFGQELFGYWILVSSLWGFGRALDLGLGTSLIKFVAEYNFKNSSRLPTIFSSSFYFLIVFGIIIFITICGIAQVFYFSNEQVIALEYHQLFWEVLIILGLTFYFNYLSYFYKSVFEGLNNFVLSSKISLTYSILILISVVIVYFFKLTIINLAIFFLASSLISLFMYLLIFRIEFAYAIPSIKYVKVSTLKEILYYSMAIQSAAIFGSLIDPVIKYLLGSMSGIGSVSIYEIARRFVTAVTGLFDTTFRPILPKSSTLNSKEEYREFIYKDCIKLSKIGITYSGLIFGVGSLIIPVLIREIFGYDEAILLYLVLAIPESINKFGYPIYNLLIGIGRAYFISLVQLINIVIIGFSVYLGLQLFQNYLGLLGYGLTVIIVNVMMIEFTRKITKISINKYFIEANGYKLILLILLLLSSVFAVFYKYIDIYIAMLGLGVISLILFIKDILQSSNVLLRILSLKSDV